MEALATVGVTIGYTRRLHDRFTRVWKLGVTTLGKEWFGIKPLFVRSIRSPKHLIPIPLAKAIEAFTGPWLADDVIEDPPSQTKRSVGRLLTRNTVASK